MKKNTEFAQMKNFQKLNEKELQEIRGGDKRGMMDLFRQIPIFRKK